MQKHIALSIRLLGIILLLLGLLVNTFSLGYLASDGVIRSLIFNAIILAFQIILITSGIYCIRRPALNSLLNLGLSAISIVLILLVMEQACRVMLFGAHTFSIRDMNSVKLLGNTGYVQRTNLPLMDYELKPGINDLWCLVPIKTNSMGLRDEEHPIKKPEKTFRIAVLGDSFTFPLGVRTEDAYHTLLEKQLQKDNLGTDIEVINFAVPGYQLTHYLGQLKQKVMQYEPDLILIGFCAENDFAITDDTFLKYIEERQKMPPFFTYYTATMLKALHYVPIPEMNKTPNEAEMKYMGDLFNEMQALCRPKNIPIIVAYLTHVPRPAPFLDVLSSATGIHTVNCTLDFDAKDIAKNSIYHPVDSHPNARANKIFFEKIYQYLCENKLVPISASDPASSPSAHNVQ